MYPMATYPPSVVCWTESAWSMLSFHPKMRSHNILPFASVLRMNESSHGRYSPQSFWLQENVTPALMYPPSEVCLTESTLSDSFPPHKSNVLFHCKFPSTSVFIRYASPVLSSK